ncbi:hypothetical protein [Pseudomonas sp. Pseusp3]
MPIILPRWMPLSILFMLAFGLACLVNYPSLKQQKEVIARHADNVMAVTLLIFGAGIFVGIMSGTGMIKATRTTSSRSCRHRLGITCR